MVARNARRLCTADPIARVGRPGKIAATGRKCASATGAETSTFHRRDAVATGTVVFDGRQFVNGSTGEAVIETLEDKNLDTPS